ncbi:MAG: hypothetical protein ABIW81_06485 [Terrimesophilobacter sp.]
MSGLPGNSQVHDRGSRDVDVVVIGAGPAGDVTPPGPKQLNIAAGAGAMVADGINRDGMLGLPATL